MPSYSPNTPTTRTTLPSGNQNIVAALTKPVTGTLTWTWTGTLSSTSTSTLTNSASATKTFNLPVGNSTLVVTLTIGGKSCSKTYYFTVILNITMDMKLAGNWTAPNTPSTRITDPGTWQAFFSSAITGTLTWTWTGQHTQVYTQALVGVTQSPGVSFLNLLWDSGPGNSTLVISITPQVGLVIPKTFYVTSTGGPP